MFQKRLTKLVLIMFALTTLLVLVGCNGPQDVLGTYSSANNGSITITAFDGKDGEFKANNIILPRLNNGNDYSTDSKDIELFTVYRQNGNIYFFRASLNEVAYIGTFDSSTLTLTIENISYKVTK